MGWSHDDLPAHEGYIVGLVALEGSSYRTRELGSRDGDGDQPVERIQVACSCGWRSAIVRAPLGAEFFPSIVTFRKGDEERIEDRALLEWNAHIDRERARFGGRYYVLAALSEWCASQANPVTWRLMHWLDEHKLNDGPRRVRGFELMVVDHEAQFAADSRAFEHADEDGVYECELPYIWRHVCVDLDELAEPTRDWLERQKIGANAPLFCPVCFQRTKNASLDAEGKWTWECSEGCNP